MKIIKKGREQDGPAKELVCTGEGFNGGGCGAVLLVSRKDLVQKLKNIPNVYRICFCFKCPCCETYTEVTWW